MSAPAVIIFNGASSVGKSSVAGALQRLASRPMLHVALDAFLAMMPTSSFDTAEGLTFVTRETDGHLSSEVVVGPVAARLISGMRAAVRGLVDTGNEVIVDDVMFGMGEQDDYRRLLDMADVRFVGLKAPLAVLEARERARGDRMIGLARWQHRLVHTNRSYDLEIDTADHSPDQIAHMIIDAFGL